MTTLPFRRLLPLLLFDLLLFAEASAADPMSDREFFASLDLNRAGLEPVAEALAAGDTAAAGAALQTYYHNRTTHQYFPLRVWGDDVEAEDALNNYFTVVDVRLPAEEEDGTVDWSRRYSGDDEWHWQFHRMEWLPEMAGLYTGTGDERWAAGWIRHVRDWILNNPPGYPRTLDTGNRLKAWVESYQHLVHALPSASITPDDHTLLLKSLIEQARFLRANWKDEGNWGASETRGLGAVVALFPEFRFTPEGSHADWVDLVLSRLKHHLGNDFLPDGVQYETSPMYHTYEYRNLLQTYELLAMNGVPVEGELVDLFLRPGQYLLYVSRPDGLLPPISDSDRIDTHIRYLASVGRLLDRPEFDYVVSRGAQGSPPKLFAAFPDGGVVAMRSGWGSGPEDFDQALHLVFDYGSNQPWHAHYDLLSFEAYAYGRGIVRDAGRYTYSSSGGWRNYFKGTPIHNTITVDGRNQGGIAGGEAEWHSGTGLDFVRAWHHAYAGLRHERTILFIRPEYWIVFDRVTGEGAHDYDLHFQFESGLPVRLNEETNAVLSSAFTLMPARTDASVELRTEWVSNNYGSRQEAPAVRYSKSGAAPVTFETVLYPYPERRVTVSTTSLDVRNGAGDVLDRSQARALNVRFPNHEDLVLLNDAGIASLHTTGVDAEAQAAVIRRDEGQVLRFEVVQGRSLADGSLQLLSVEGSPVNASVDEQAAHFSGGFQHLTAWAPGAEDVRVDGKTVSFVRSGEHISIHGEAVGVEAPLPASPEAVRLEGSYPNPVSASGTTLIRYTLAASEMVELALFDVLGRRVRTLASAQQPAGSHEISFHVHGLAPGLYVYRLHTARHTASRTMIIL